ncbi:MAG: TatD family deoxyribonuclease [Candidatus Syntrophonatronum acetioxidans]|uniref:TatD family deoxyribonuclease n=1 Tax=Candidatus Syntrophonatronum acetioxidans TaxID=1795816 RepID=A0A424YEN1_9FIRM|nr:MAG: TatD family deoxyribonuclease [Candidatus Syntrophonatronum acetioxidans]
MASLADSHAHLIDKAYRRDEKEVIQRALDKGVKLIINLGYDLRTSLAAVKLAQDYPFIYASVGIHPHEAGKVPENYQERLKKMAQREKVVAIGEIGLDYYRDLSPRKKQQEVFKEQLRVARELKYPVIIHDREAHEDILRILEEERGGEYGGVLHCFSGDWKMARKCIDMGFHISIAGPVTFKKSDKLQEVAKKLPLDRILVETDCPYLAPVPFRGKRNEPSYVKFTLEKIASLRGIRWEDLAQATYENTKRVFNLD